VDLLEYLFLIEDPELERKYEEYKNLIGGVLKMTVDEIRRKHFEQKGMEKGIEKGIEKGELKKAIEIAKKLLDILDDETISSKTGLPVDKIRELRN
ncbi:MAG: hypothetical protein N4A57_00715, partial [Anaeromicrobium sp.]|nr:hypothetical protein [Anaeromicrobium sp.]